MPCAQLTNTDAITQSIFILNTIYSFIANINVLHFINAINSFVLMNAKVLATATTNHYIYNYSKKKKGTRSFF